MLQLMSVLTPLLTDMNCLHSTTTPLFTHVTCCSTCLHTILQLLLYLPLMFSNMLPHPRHNCSLFSPFMTHLNARASSPVFIHRPIPVPSHSHHVHAFLSEAEGTEETGERGEDGGCLRAGENIRA